MMTVLRFVRVTVPADNFFCDSFFTADSYFLDCFACIGGLPRQTKTPANSKFALCGLTFKFEKLYLRFIFVMADNFVFQNPAHRKLAKRYSQCLKQHHYPDT